MSNQKRPRGRPRGSGKDDQPYLAQVADLLIREPSLKATTAMKRVMMSRTWTETEETLVRRWQVKWKEQKEALLSAARERARPRPTVPLRDVLASMKAIEAMRIDFPALAEARKAIEAYELPFKELAETVKAFQMSPALKELAEAMKAYQMPPGFMECQKAIKAMQDSLVPLHSFATWKVIEDLNQLRIVPPVFHF